MEYHQATAAELEKIWNFNIEDHPGDDRWKRWKTEYIGYNRSGAAVTFIVADGDEPVGEGTLILSPACKAVAGHNVLCNGASIANVNALRIKKKYEGQGHISRMVKLMEAYAREHGITRLTIGVDAVEARNLGIYLHWGYTEFLFSETEDGLLVLYYGKSL